MNILYITNHLNVGGITSYVFTLAKGLKLKGHNIYVASSGGECLERFLRQDLFYLAIPINTKSEISPKILISLFKLFSFIKEKGIDIVHSNSRTTQVLGSLLCRMTKAEHISTCHGFFKRRFFRKLFPCWGEKVIAISEAVQQHLQKDLGVKPEAITVIHSGVDIEKFLPAIEAGKDKNQKTKSEIKKEFGLDDGPVIGTIGRLSAEKGHVCLIEAMKNILAVVPQAQLVIIGEGKSKDGLLELIKNLRLEKNVFLLSTVSDTYQALMMMDLFVLPSLKEGLGLSLIEAMACGLPVIASDVGGIKSLIQHAVNGLLAGPKDMVGLSSSIIDLLQNPHKAEYLGKNARSFIANNFSQEKMIAQTEQFYIECLKKK